MPEGDKERMENRVDRHINESAFKEGQSAGRFRYAGDIRLYGKSGARCVTDIEGKQGRRRIVRDGMNSDLEGRKEGRDECDERYESPHLHDTDKIIQKAAGVNFKLQLSGEPGNAPSPLEGGEGNPQTHP